MKPRDWLFAALCAGFVVAQVYCDMTMPEYTQRLMKEVVGDSMTMGVVWRNGGFMLLYAFGSAACSVVCGFFAAHTAANFSKTLRKAMLDRVTSFSAAEINKFGSSSLITRTTNDVVQMQTFIAVGLQLLIKAPVLAVWAILKVSSTAVEWTVATAVVVGVIVVTVGMLVGICYPKFKRIQMLTDALNTATRESVTGVRVVRAFNAEDYQSGKFETVNDKVASNQLFTSRWLGLMMPIMTICLNGLTLAVYWIGAALINDAVGMDKVEMFADMTVFTQYAIQVVMAFMLLIMIFMILPRSLVSGKRINEVLVMHRSVRSGAVKEVKRADGVPVMEFKNVGFAYDRGDGRDVSDLSFSVNRGETVAVIGATGSGKTTIVNLLMRFYELNAGDIRIDGTSIKDMKRERVHDLFDMILQNTWLFEGTIRENLVYNKQGVTDERLNEVCAAVGLSHYIACLPDGYDTVISESSQISEGQKQQLTIARAMIKDSPLLILDEATSNVDTRTELAIQNAMDKLTEGRTSFVIAHRLSTIKNADVIMVLKDGDIIEQGNHEQLLQKKGFYAELYNAQFAGATD